MLKFKTGFARAAREFAAGGYFGADNIAFVRFEDITKSGAQVRFIKDSSISSISFPSFAITLSAILESDDDNNININESTICVMSDIFRSFANFHLIFFSPRSLLIQCYAAMGEFFGLKGHRLQLFIDAATQVFLPMLYLDP